MLLKLLLLLVVLAPVPAAPRPDPLGTGYLGVKSALASDNDLTLTEVLSGGPAAAAGLRPGDTLVKVGGQVPRQFEDVRGVVMGLRPGTRLPVEVRRAGRTVGLTVVVGAMPPEVLDAVLGNDRLRVVPVFQPNR